MSVVKNQKTSASGFICNLFSQCTLYCFIRTLVLMCHSRFVTVIYDDFHGIKRPIGLIHSIKIKGEDREVFTYCCNSKRQPNMALFVRHRKGILANDVALSFEEQDRIPSYLKTLPEAYRVEHFKDFQMAS